MDDYFGFWTGPVASFYGFIDTFNEYSIEHGFNVQIKISKFGTPCPFLDALIYQKANGEFHTRVFSKETDIHAYVVPSSHLPVSTLREIPKGVGCRILWLCSEKHV